jgi:nitroreductase
MDVLDAIRNRSSVRCFLNKPVPKEQVTQILEAARFAPSGVNTQPWQVTVVSSRLKKIIGDEIVLARESQLPENPDYAYYPKEWIEPYKSRRKACGLALYSALNIGIDDKESRKVAWYRNYYFFDAPVALIIHIDKKLEIGSWLDTGMFIQNILLAARGLGLETCAQAAMAEYPDIIRRTLSIPSDQKILCGIAIGYADWSAPINQYRTTREPVETFTRWAE